MDIPRFLQLLKEHRFEDAFESIVMDNPLPASTGRVCQHRCEDRCRRVSVDKPLNMREVHRFVADWAYLSEERFDSLVNRIAARKLPLTDRKIAVVGAGPTGLAAAFYLALFGHDVTVYDANREAGGMLRYAIPEYRLPKAVLDKEVELIAQMGVEFNFDTNVGTDITLNDLESQYHAVFISIGTWKENWVYLPGTELKGVLPALLFLEAVAKQERVEFGRKVAVIGGGNAAIDSARTAARKGADTTVIYRRERKDMPAIREEVEAAEHEGVKFVFLSSPHRIVGDDDGNVKAIEVVKTKLGEFDASGRRKPIATEEIRRYDCDTVILAVGETVDLDFARASGLKIGENKTIEVDRYTFETSRSMFYAGGDAITGASNVSNAMGGGKIAARNIDKRLMNADRFDQIMPKYEYSQIAPAEPSPVTRHVSAELAPGERVRSFEEVLLGITGTEAIEESGRCLRCDIREATHHKS
jgi:NADH-quinone oxidoreductase subunit F